MINKTLSAGPGYNGQPLDMSVRPKQPLLKTHSIPVTIKRYFTSVDGAVINKAVVPAALRVGYPFWTFGYWDQKGGYSTGLKVLPTQGDAKYLLSFVEGAAITSQQITGFTGLNTVRTRIKTGDIVHVFTDDLDAPTYLIWVVQSCRNGSLASIMGNTDIGDMNDLEIGHMEVPYFQYFTDNPNGQWFEPVRFTRSSNIASFRDEQVMPYIFKSPKTEQDGFIRMECIFGVNQFQTIGTYFLYATEEIQMNFTIKTL